MKLNSIVLIVIGLVIGLIVLVVLLSFIAVVSREEQKSEIPVKTKQETPEEKTGETTTQAPEEIFSFRGEIVSITVGEVQVRPFQAFKDLVNLKEALDLTVKTTESTQYNQANISEGKVDSKIIKFADLKVGNSVLVVSPSNIKDKQTFEASKITIVNVIKLKD